MKKHLMPATALVAFAAAKRNAALRSETQCLQLSLDAHNLRQYQDYLEQRRLRAEEAQD
jgi:hypothetical protein